MRGCKNEKKDGIETIIAEAWNWTNPFYSLFLKSSFGNVERIEIDPFRLVADVNTENNTKVLKGDTDYYFQR